MGKHLKSIAERIKGLREIMHISIEDMARNTELTPEDYLVCETGKQDLTFSFLYKCANRFGIDVSELVTGTDPKLDNYTVCRKGNGMPIKRREGFEYKHLAASLKNRLAEPCHVKVKYSKEQEKKPIMLTRHAGQELDFVLKGTLKVQIGEQQVILKEGDSIYYDASNKHGMVAVNGEDCEFLVIGVKGNYDEYMQPQPVDEIEPAAAESKRDKLLYKKYVKETLDENGHLKDIAFMIPDNFNFGFDVVDVLAKKTPDKTAMLWESNTHDVKKFTFEDISAYSAQTANYFESLGIRKGDRVMLVLKRHYQFWFAIVALHKIGAVVIPATNQLTKKDFVYRFNAAGVKAIICTADGEVADAIDESLPESPTVTIKAMVNGTKPGWNNFDEGILAHSPIYERPSGTLENKSSDPMLMYFTSGTTGYPKIAEQSYTYPLGHIVTARWWHNVDPDGLHFAISDTGWGKAVWGKIYGQWLCEAPIFTYDFDRFHADDILKLFAKHQITTFCAPPTMYRMFIKEDLHNYDLSSLQYACTAGEALNPEVYYQFQKVTGLKMMEGFGQTETTLIAGNLIGMEPKPGSMGKPNPQYKVSLVNHKGESIKPGEVGEIVLRTTKGKPIGMFSEYYKDEKNTAASWHDGLYHTGDMAWRDEEGYLWYVGRTDDIIKSSGYRIGPFEIESVIMELPYVLECAVTGTPDPVRGQVVKATIVLTKNTSPSDVLRKEIQTYVKEHTAPYKYPRVVEFVEELPKTISGKVRRVQLREESQAKLEAQK